MKKFMVVVVLFAMLFAYNSMQTHATVGPLTEELRILADGESFTLWAVGNDTGISAFRLEDIAYILNGTPAQFNLRPAPDGFHYWIVRGEAYTPTGQEFRPVYYTISQGTMWANTSYMRIRVGVDGEDFPETVLPFNTLIDCDGAYFGIRILGALLGFSVDWCWFWYHVHNLHDFYVEDAELVISTGGSYPATLPVQTIEFLDLMWEMGGHWVDIVHFESPVIDESIIWPMEFHIPLEGHGLRYSSWHSIAPINPPNDDWWRWWYPLEMYRLDCGLIELTVGYEPRLRWDYLHEGTSDRTHSPYSRRILVDTSNLPVDELIYYVDETRFHMVRPYRSIRDPRRYTVETYEGGGIRLRYVLGREAFWQDNIGLRIYRSSVPGYIGRLVHIQNFIYYNDPILYEFVDLAVHDGIVYYYSIWQISTWQNREMMFGEDVWQMRVCIDTVRSAAETTPALSRIWQIRVLGAAVLLVIVLCIRKKASRTRVFYYTPFPF